MLADTLFNPDGTHHYFTVLLFVYVLVTEHVAGTRHYKFASLLRGTQEVILPQVHACVCVCLTLPGNKHENYGWPLTFPWWKARTGLLRGKQTEPVERTATAGLITLSVAPYGYTNVSALQERRRESGKVQTPCGSLKEGPWW